MRNTIGLLFEVLALSLTAPAWAGSYDITPTDGTGSVTVTPSGGSASTDSNPGVGYSSPYGFMGSITYNWTQTYAYSWNPDEQTEDSAPDEPTDQTYDFGGSVTFNFGGTSSYVPCSTVTATATGHASIDGVDAGTVQFNVTTDGTYWNDTNPDGNNGIALQISDPHVLSGWDGTLNVTYSMTFDTGAFYLINGSAIFAVNTPMSSPTRFIYITSPNNGDSVALDAGGTVNGTLKWKGNHGWVLLRTYWARATANNGDYTHVIGTSDPLSLGDEGDQYHHLRGSGWHDAIWHLGGLTSADHWAVRWLISYSDLGDPPGANPLDMASVRFNTKP